MTDWSGESLYHYTTFQALEGILRNREIWLGNLRYMNDRMEMRQFFHSLKETIKSEHPEYEEKIENLFKGQIGRFEGKTAYAFSMSKLCDDAAQWDRYSNSGRGVCVKFSAGTLLDRVKDKAVLQPVYYSEDMSNHQIKAIIELFIMNGKIWNGFKTIDEVFENAWACSVAFKHPTFRAEDEVRIVSFPFPREGYFTGNLKYISSRDGLREYYPVKLCSDVERNYGGCIEEIILGPCSGVDKNLFFRYLQDIGADIHSLSISESKCPLR